MARTAAIAPVCSHSSKDAREIKRGIPVENEQGYLSDGNREGKKNLHRRSRRERRKTGGKEEEREGKPHKLKSERNHVPRQRDKTTEDLENSGKTLGDLVD